MKQNSLIAPALSVALLLGAAAPALASDTVSASGTVQINQQSQTVHVDTEASTEHDGRFTLQGSGLFASGTSRTRGEDMHKGSSTEDRMHNKGEANFHHILVGQEKGSEAIDARIESLTELSARLANLKLLSPEILASIQISLNAEIAKLTALKAQISSDTSTTTLKKNLKDITEGNRVFLVVEPKARIAASASRINAVVTQMQALSTKLQTRITTAQTAGVNVTAATTALTDLNAKIADAKVQAAAAVSLTANLQADNGDATVKAANKAALKEARTKLELANKDLAAARHDVGSIYAVVKVSEHTTASTTPTH